MKSANFLFFLLIAAILTTTAIAQSPPENRKSEFMFVDEIKAGMTGYGISAFKDNQLERFDVEILGVMKGAFAGMDMILARLSSPYMEDSGVIAGMSGSPVYINDRMIGAVAYGWAFAQEPVAGITPIENMLEVYDRTDDKKHPPDHAPTGDFLDQWKSAKPEIPRSEPVTVKSSSIQGLNNTNSEYPETISFEPLGTPLIISGAHPAVMKRARHYFKDSSLMPVMGGGGHVINPDLKHKPIENGSAVAIPMMSGSMEMSALGTVTYRKGNKMIAYGHPFFNEGNINAPFASAHVYTIMPSYMRSFKLGASVREVGAIRQDRRSAIGGYFGMEPPVFDMKVSLSFREYKREPENKEFQYRIWEHDLYSPMLADMALAQSIVDNDKLSGNSAAKVNYRIRLENGEVIEKENFFSSQAILAFSVSMPLYFDIYRLLTNPFRETGVENISCEVEIINQYKAVGIEAVDLDKDIYKPGETVKVNIHFVPYREPRFTRNLRIQLPQDIRNGVYTLNILDGPGRQSFEYSRSPGRSNIRSYETLLENIKMNFPSNRLYGLLVEADSGLRVGDEDMPGLPPSVLQVTKESSVSAFTAPINMNVILEETLDTNFEIRGSHSLKIKVDNRGRR